MKSMKEEKKRELKFSKIYIEITNVCNLNCKFCAPHNRENKELSISEFRNIIAKIKKYTDLVYFHVKGEPLLHSSLDALLRICEENGLMVNLTTNGLLLEKWNDVLKKSKSLRQINISLHAAEQNREIDMLKYMEYILAEVSDIKKESDVIISYRLWNISDLENNKINKDIFRSLEKKYDIKNLYKRAKKEKFIELDNNIFLNQDYQFEWPDMKNKVINTIGKCYGLKSQIGILSDGTIVPCCLDGNGDINLGNIFEIDNLEEFIKSPRCENIKDGFKKRELREELCKRCGFIKKFE